MNQKDIEVLIFIRGVFRTATMERLAKVVVNNKPLTILRNALSYKLQI